MACRLGRRQAIIWINDRILLIGPLGTNFSEILSEIHTFSFKKMHLKTSSNKLGENMDIFDKSLMIYNIYKQYRRRHAQEFLSLYLLVSLLYIKIWQTTIC